MEKLKIPDPLGRSPFKKMNFNSDVAGVEIGSDWLKILQRERGKQGKAVCRVQLVKLAEVKDSIAAALADSFRLMKFNKQHVVACIPRHLATVRMLDLPATDPKEISDMIELQVGKQTPYAKEEILFAHKIVETGASGYTKVMLAIVVRTLVNERLAAMAQAGLTVKRVAISSEGVFQWFRGAYRPEVKTASAQTLILLDIDSNYSDFIVIRRGNMVFTRNILIGSNHLMREAAEWRSKFVDELKRSLEQSQSTEKNVEIVRAYLSGAGPNIPGLDVALSEALELRVENVDKLRDFHPGETIECSQAAQLKLVSMTQLSGVTRGDKEPCLDLTPREQKVQNVMERKTRQLTVMGILAVAIVTALSFLSLTFVHTKTAYLAKLKKKIASIAVDAEAIDKMRGVIDVVEQRLDARGSSLECLTEIYRVTPEEISLTDIDIDEKQQVVLKGHGFAMADIFKYAKTLEASEMFGNVKTPSVKVKNDKDSKFAEFEIICAYQKE